MRQTLGAATLALVISVLPAASRGQVPGMKLNIAAGAAFATGNFGSRNNTGYNVAAGLNLTPPLSPLGFRVEGLYNEFDQNFTNPGFGSSGGKTRVGGVTANAMYDLPIGIPTGGLVALYAIGGAGYYISKEPALDVNSQNNFGWNIGAGFRFPLTGFSAYVEARYHSVSNVDISMIPLSFGLIF